MIHPSNGNATYRVVDDPFELRELASMSSTGAIEGVDREHGELLCEIDKEQLKLYRWEQDDYGANHDWKRRWSYLEILEERHRFELAFLLTMEWRPARDGTWISLLDAMARQ